tara:strand:+ start:404 stop:661 length:258 start_codon:yes stop_codon:yes gene_type:complete
VADNEVEEQQTERESVTLSGSELLRLIIFTPVVITWLVLATRIIWSATSSKETLDSIEGLLTALAVLTIPVSAGLNELWKGSKDK